MPGRSELSPTSADLEATVDALGHQSHTDTNKESTMKKIAMALVGGALALTLAAPAGAAVGPPTNQPGVSRHEDRRAHNCSDEHSQRERGNGDCYDDRGPQHDGGGSILF
jgi:hypothetical protein